MAKREADFLESTKKIIAARAGYRCSFPECDESTVGPGAGPEDVERKGVAAHIYAAEDGGPRGTGGLTPEQRQSAMNGIWCCQDHGRIIDNDDGKNYPANSLLSWKSLHEQLIANEMRKVSTRSGWLQEVEIRRSPLFAANSIIRFGKVTLLFGENSTGKTALCQWIAAAFGMPTMMERWQKAGDRNNNIQLGFKLFSPQPLRCECIFDGNRLDCRVNGQAVSDLSHVLRLRYPNEQLWHPCGMNTVDLLACLWRVHPYEVPALLDAMCWDRYGFVREIEIRDVVLDPEESEQEAVEPPQPVKVLYAKIGDHRSLFAFDALAGREVSQIIASGAIALADRDSENQHVVLIIELGGHLLPDELLSTYARRLADPQFTFQTILVSPNERSKVDWTGWSIVRLVGKPPDVHILQDSIT